MRHNLRLGRCLLLAAFLPGCIADTRSGPATCKVHDVTMQTRLVRIKYGLRREPPAEYQRATAELFPNAYSYAEGGCVVSQNRDALIWRCPKCVEAKVNWLREHHAMNEWYVD